MTQTKKADKEKKSQPAIESAGLFVEPGLLKQMVQAVVQEVLEEEVSRHLGAGPYERSEARRGWRNGTKPRTMKTAVGRLDLELPQVRDGSFHTTLFERYQRSEKAVVMALQEMYVKGGSTRAVGEVMEAMGGFQVSAGTVSRAAAELDEQVREFRTRDLSGQLWPYLVIDARYERVRREGRVVKLAVLVAAGINEEGRREILGYYLGDSESEATWAEVFKDLKARGLAEVELVVSDAHKGIIAAMGRQMQGIGWQRCRVHLIRDLLNKVGWRERKALAAELKAVWASEERGQCLAVAEEVALRWEKKAPKMAAALRAGVEETLTVLVLPREHRRRLHSTNMLERLMRTIRARTRVVSIFPNESSAIRLIGALLIELDEDWKAEKCRYLNMDRKN